MPDKEQGSESPINPDATSEMEMLFQDRPVAGEVVKPYDLIKLLAMDGAKESPPTKFLDDDVSKTVSYDIGTRSKYGQREYLFMCFDANERLRSVAKNQDGFSDTFVFSYDQIGRLAKIVHYDGFGKDETTFIYNSDVPDDNGRFGYEVSMSSHSGLK